MLKLPVYLDNNATTPMDPRVLEAMIPYFTEHFGNAASRNHPFGWEAEEAVDYAREQVAKLIGADPKEIIFTSGGTESDNLAIFGVAAAIAPRSSTLGVESPKTPSVFPRGAHIITTKFEHHAVLEPCQQLVKEGFDVTFLDVGEYGLINSEDVRKALRPETILVSIMYANNEIGTIQPIAEIGKIIKEFRELKRKSYPLFHTDACQAAGYLDLTVNNLGVDLIVTKFPFFANLLSNR